MDDAPHAYCSPRLEVRPLAEKGYYGVFAREAIPAGELLVMWAGRLMTREQFDRLPPLQRSRSVQVEEELYLVPMRTEAGDFVNHSCNPNAGLSGQIALVALREIAAAEEITYDYAMTDGSPYDEFDCCCGAPDCRGRIRGDDWQRPELQARYRGYFSPYLQRRINRLHANHRNGAQPVTEAG
ncbi:MAG: SET domain-containing protein-lysine N-methyltransferase [Chloroflexi bacterium]|nr:SET domain-containing protein-lysine N-methyltransferase [Chloroflexota bacterium]